MIESFAQTPAGALMIANGYDPVLIWDGMTSQPEQAGLPPPANACGITAAITGPVVLDASGNEQFIDGTYYAYVRYLDAQGNHSNLSPISNALTAQGATATTFYMNLPATTPLTLIAASPTTWTPIAHGLASGDLVRISLVYHTMDINGVWTTVGNLIHGKAWTVSVVNATTIRLVGTTAAMVPQPITAWNVTYSQYVPGLVLSRTPVYADKVSGTWVRGTRSIGYNNVPVPTNPKVKRRQILRNTSGQATTFYVDVDTTDLTTTTFTSTRRDAELQTQTAVPLVNEDGISLANLHNVPPNHKAAIAHHQDRMFLAVDKEYTRGACKVTTGSTTVTGVGTSWPSTMAGRFLYVTGADRAYEIASVNTTAQTLTLTEAYRSVTDNFAVYAIRPAPAERRLVYFSEAGYPQSWPPTNAFTVQEDGDEITGLMPKGSFIYVLEKRHIYRITFQSNPSVDGAVYQSGSRGCVNNRCWAMAGDFAYMLDEEGVHAFGDSDTKPIDAGIRHIFDPKMPGPFHINWSAQEWFHAVHHPIEKTIRWFVAMAGETRPRHALCYAYDLGVWWIEEFPCPIGGACVGYMGRQQRLFYGLTNKRVAVYGEKYLDGPDAASGTVRGTVTSATSVTMTDSLATFPTSGMVNNPVVIVTGRGKGQIRTVVKVDGTTLTVNEPWLILPDTTSVYQLGGIPWRWKSTWFRFAPLEETNERRVEIIFEPAKKDCSMDMRLYLDAADSPWKMGTTMVAAEGNGVATVKGEADVVVDLTKATGIAQKRGLGHKELLMDGGRYTQLELRGVSNQDLVRIYQMTYDGVTPPAGGNQ